MKGIERRSTRLALVLCITFLTAAVLVVPGSRPTRAQEGGAQAKEGQPEQPQAALGSGFTYQGRLNAGANPANGRYNFTFKLFNAASAGSQVGSTITSANLAVSEGLFSVTLDFGAAALSGEALWLQVAVRPAGGGGYTTLNPRQALTATPYALSLRADSTIGGSGAQVLTVVNNNSAGGTGPSAATAGGIGVRGVSNSMNGTGVLGQADNGALAHGVWGKSAQGHGVQGDSTDNSGVYGWSLNFEGVHGETASNYAGVFGHNSSTSYQAPGVRGDGTAGPGVYGFSTFFEGVHGETGSNYPGVYGHNSSTSYAAPGVRGDGTEGPGVYGFSSSDAGVYGNAPGGPGVFGEAANTGVAGSATGNNGVGVYGKSSAGASGAGVSGYSMFGIGVRGESDSDSGVGVYGSNPAIDGIGVLGVGDTGVVAKGTTSSLVVRAGGSGYAAALVEGDARVTGDLFLDGDCDNCLAPSRMDDPLDPANKYLYHAAVESPDMLNVYNGNVTTDAQGEAVVTMPAYFEALNKDFRYQLTVLGQFAQAIVANKIANNRFTIKTDKPNVEVSWQVTGIRNDPYSQAHQQPVEVDKQGAERGKYLHPQEYGQPDDKAINGAGQHLPESGGQK